MTWHSTCVLLVLLIEFLYGQMEFSHQERLQGYKNAPNGVYFIFDENLYKIQPAKVIVEGSFRNWDHDMSDTIWWLKKISPESSLWILNSPLDIEIQASFKFRINHGDWVSPPENAPNLKNGNLIYAIDQNPVKITAEIVTERDIRVFLSGDQMAISFDPQNYVLLKSDGSPIPISNVFYSRPGEIQIYPAEAIDIRRVHYLKEKKHGLMTLVSFDGYFRHLYSEKKLGAFYDASDDKTIFRLFAPRATHINLYLYQTPEKDHYAKHPLQSYPDGVWEFTISGNLEGQYYDYTVHGPDEPGSQFYESNPVHITDPYGQVSVDSFGPCRIWPLVSPPRPVAGGRPKMEDVIAYEVHIQDFTQNLPIDKNKKGTFSGFIESNLYNSVGEKIGFDHLTELGINVVHLQPVQEFLHYPDAAWQETFIDDPYMIEQGINTENYQWGYRTTHFMAIESQYREKDTKWGEQNRQFRDFIETFHDAGIAVVVDVVFNHTGERMDGRMNYFNFSVIDRPYYYRTDKTLNYIGAYGTETKSEERPMVQRWIIDQCKNLVDQYGVDGFRIDLAGQTDEQTLRELKKRLGPDIIIYGEPWIGSDDPDYENNPDWDWYKADAPITFFQDEARDAFKGSPFKLENKLTDRGYAGGNGDRESVKRALSSGFADDHTPISGINYLDIHDNWALADRFAVTNWDGRYGVDENRIKIAATLLFTSLGPIVIHGGTEFLRSKGRAPLKEITQSFQGSKLYFHGKNDTYNLARANEIVWENKGKSFGDDDGNIRCNYKNMNDYWQGLIAMRRSRTGEIFRIKNTPEKDHYRWIEPENNKLLGYMIDEKILVLINTDTTRREFKNITVPDSSWSLIADINDVRYDSGIQGENFSTLHTGEDYTIDLGPAELLIWKKD